MHRQPGAGSFRNMPVIAYSVYDSNKHVLGYNDQVRVHRLKAAELFDLYVRIDPSAEHIASHFRDKAKRSESE